jgi:hypothetical protein
MSCRRGTSRSATVRAPSTSSLDTNPTAPPRSTTRGRDTIITSTSRHPAGLQVLPTTLPTPPLRSMSRTLVCRFVFRLFIHTLILNSAVTYLASVGVGEPATNYDLLIVSIHFFFVHPLTFCQDTGSSNTWISAVDKPFKPTSTSKVDLFSLLYLCLIFFRTRARNSYVLSPSLLCISFCSANLLRSRLLLRH